MGRGRSYLPMWLRLKPLLILTGVLELRWHLTLPKLVPWNQNFVSLHQSVISCEPPPGGVLALDEIVSCESGQHTVKEEAGSCQQLAFSAAGWFKRSGQNTTVSTPGSLHSHSWAPWGLCSSLLSVFPWCVEGKPRKVKSRVRDSSIDSRCMILRMSPKLPWPQG